MSSISGRILKLEAQRAPVSPAVKVERHIVTGTTEAEREAKIEAVMASSSDNVLHIIRTIVQPRHQKTPSCPA